MNEKLLHPHEVIVAQKAALDSQRAALEQIALLDEADGHELTADHARQAVAIATRTLGEHPSEIFARHALEQLQHSTEVKP
jgi:hypothetical protein